MNKFIIVESLFNFPTHKGKPSRNLKRKNPVSKMKQGIKRWLIGYHTLQEAPGYPALDFLVLRMPHAGSGIRRL